MNIMPSAKKTNESPKKPLSAYNLFFQYQRIKLLQSPNGSDQGKEKCALPGLEGVDHSSPLLSDTAAIRKLRKEVIEKTLNENPFRISEKRSHVKTHGKMSFLEMSKHMGKQWKGSDEVTRSIFRQLANEGKAKFNKAVTDSYKVTCSKFYGKIGNLNLPMNHSPYVSPLAIMPPAIVTPPAVPKEVYMPPAMPETVVSSTEALLASNDLLNQNVDFRSGNQTWNTERLLSFVRPEEDINDDEFRRLLTQLDWSRLGS